MAECSMIYNYTRPEVVPSRQLIHMKKARHPCLELQVELFEDGEGFIPNDVYMHKGRFPLFLLSFILSLRSIRYL